MLQVMNPGSTESHQMGGSNNTQIVFGCWEKAPPLLKELEQTVNFAERKCGDLMQQLSFYKEYYKKWSQSDQKVHPIHAKKRNRRKCCKKTTDSETSSDDGCSLKKSKGHKVNAMFYEKLRNKISEVNEEIADANRRLGLRSANVPSGEATIDTHQNIRIEKAKLLEKVESKIDFDYPNKVIKSEPNIASNMFSISELSLAENSKRSIWTRLNNTIIKKPPLKRVPNLLRYKLRSKSLPQGVKRKFGFGSYVDVVMPGKILKSPKSKMSILTVRSSKSARGGRKEDVKPKTADKISRPAFKTRRNVTRSSNIKNEKTNGVILKKSEGTTKITNGAGVGTSSARKENFAQRKVVSQSNLPNSMSRSQFSSVPPSTTNLTDFSVFEGDDVVAPKAKTASVRKMNSVMSLRKQIPFTICASTSKSFNIGMNIQQVLSLIKHKKPTVHLQALVDSDVQRTRTLVHNDIPETNAVNTLFFNRPSTSPGKVDVDICPARQEMINDDCLSVMTENTDSRSRCTILSQAQSVRSELNQVSKKITKDFLDPCSLPKFDETQSVVDKVQRPEDVWVVEQPDATSGMDTRRSRSRCTCFPTKQCVDYHKILKQYTSSKFPLTKSESNQNLTSYGYTDYRPKISYSSQLYPIPSQEHIDRKSMSAGGGDHRNSRGFRVEVDKIHDELLNLHRKYTLLQQKMGQNNVNDFETVNEMESLESELTEKELEYKNIIGFYNQFMVLKDQLKSLKQKQNPNSNSMSLPLLQPQYQSKLRKDPRRPTPSMTLAKMLRQIQCLQDKIKEADNP